MNAGPQVFELPRFLSDRFTRDFAALTHARDETTLLDAVIDGVLKHFAPAFVLTHIDCGAVNYAACRSKFSLEFGVTRGGEFAEALRTRWMEAELHETVVELLSKKLTASSYSYFSWPGNSFELRSQDGTTRLQVPGNYVILVPWSSECVARKTTDPEFFGYSVMGFGQWPEFDDDQVQSLVLIPGLISSLFQSVFAKSSDDYTAYVHDVKHFLETGSCTLRGLSAEDDTNKERLSRSFTRLQIATDSMLVALKEEQRVMRASKVPVDVRTLITETIDELVPLASVGQHSIKCSGLDTVGVAELDPSLLPVAIRNIVENALRYAIPKSTIEIRGREAENWIFLTCSSQGAVLNAEECANVFEKYFRSRGSMGQTGTGLGLYIVKRIVEAHGGRVSFSSCADSGNTIELVLPLRRACGVESLHGLERSGSPS